MPAIGYPFLLSFVTCPPSAVSFYGCKDRLFLGDLLTFCCLNCRNRLFSWPKSNQLISISCLLPCFCDNFLSLSSLSASFSHVSLGQFSLHHVRLRPTYLIAFLRLAILAVGRCHFVGCLETKKKCENKNAADCFVLPSISTIFAVEKICLFINYNEKN